jgi:hypothetical protein
VGGRPRAIALGKGVEQGLHTRTTTYLALAVTSMSSMLAVVVKRAERCCCVVGAGKGGEGERVEDDHDEHYHN